MKRCVLPLTQGKIAIVDEQDFNCLSQYDWTFDGVYAHRSVKIGNKWTHVRLHHVILGKHPVGLHVDHRNGDKLDNRRSNLRFATRSQNLANAKLRKDNTSGAKGVYQIGEHKWYAQVRANGRTYHVGRFTNFNDAVNARHRRAIQLHGEFANTPTRNTYAT